MNRRTVSLAKGLSTGRLRRAISVHGDLLMADDDAAGGQRFLNRKWSRL
jgi:hypothetical protein